MGKGSLGEVTTGPLSGAATYPPGLRPSAAFCVMYHHWSPPETGQRAGGPAGEKNGEGFEPALLMCEALLLKPLHTQTTQEPRLVHGLSQPPPRTEPLSG